MAIKSRLELNAAFSKGKRPKEEDFRNWQESYYHKDEDTITVTGWMVRSFFKDLRAEGLAIATGGATMIDIPITAKRLNKIRVIGKATGSPAPFTINVSLGYFSDTSVASLNPQIITTNNPLPNGFFFHPLLGPTAPAIAFSFTSSQVFDRTFDFVSSAVNVMLNFDQARFLRLTLSIASGSFPNTLGDPSYVYYGLEFE